MIDEKQVFKFIDASGHALHELGIYETRNGRLFVGDAIKHNVYGTDIYKICL